MSWARKPLFGTCGTKLRCHYLLLLEEDCDDVVAALQPNGMPMMSLDIVESVNRITKAGYNDHSDPLTFPRPFPAPRNGSWRQGGRYGGVRGEWGVWRCSSCSRCC